MHNPLTSRRSVMHGGMLLVSGPAAVVLCLSGALAGAWQPALMRPRAFQPHRPAELLLGRDDCPGCSQAYFYDCITQLAPQCHRCHHTPYGEPMVTCPVTFKVYADEVYTACTGTFYQGWECYTHAFMPCWVQWFCKSVYKEDYKCDQNQPPHCSVMAKGYKCRHCQYDQPTGLLDWRWVEWCVECDQGS